MPTSAEVAARSPVVVTKSENATSTPTSVNASAIPSASACSSLFEAITAIPPRSSSTPASAMSSRHRRVAPVEAHVGRDPQPAGSFGLVAARCGGHEDRVVQLGEALVHVDGTGSGESAEHGEHRGVLGELDAHLIGRCRPDRQVALVDEFDVATEHPAVLVVPGRDRIRDRRVVDEREIETELAVEQFEVDRAVADRDRVGRDTRGGGGQDDVVGDVGLVGLLAGGPGFGGGDRCRGGRRRIVSCGPIPVVAARDGEQGQAEQQHDRHPSRTSLTGRHRFPLPEMSSSAECVAVGVSIGVAVGEGKSMHRRASPGDDAGMGAYLRARGLRKQFDDTLAVGGVDVTVDRGERVALVGPNGAGKTTTLLMLLGAIEPDQGAVEIDGRDLAVDRVGAMAGVGFAAGYLPLPRYLSVRETLEFFASLHGLSDPRNAVSAALAQWGIERLADQKTQTLSSGQSTLVGLAKAILHEPELVVLDEPTASLDPEVAHRVRHGLLRLNDEIGTAILVTSHDMREVELLGQRLVFLARGTVLHEGRARRRGRRDRRRRPRVALPARGRDRTGGGLVSRHLP